MVAARLSISSLLRTSPHLESGMPDERERERGVHGVVGWRHVSSSSPATRRPPVDFSCPQRCRGPLACSARHMPSRVALMRCWLAAAESVVGGAGVLLRRRGGCGVCIGGLAVAALGAAQQSTTLGARQRFDLETKQPGQEASDERSRYPNREHVNPFVITNWCDS